METTCRQLEECMNQDPSAVGRTKVAAETFAQVANSFVEEISWKTFVSISMPFDWVVMIADSFFGVLGIHFNLCSVCYCFHQYVAVPISLTTCTLTCVTHCFCTPRDRPRPSFHGTSSYLGRSKLAGWRATWLAGNAASEENDDNL